LGGSLEKPVESGRPKKLLKWPRLDPVLHSRVTLPQADHVYERTLFKPPSARERHRSRRCSHPRLIDIDR